MADQYVADGVLFLRSLNIRPFGLDLSDVKYVSPEFHATIKKSELEEGDVVIVRTGRPGTCAVIPKGLGLVNCSDLVIVRCGPKLRPHFLCYWVNAMAGHHVRAHAVGAVQQHFNVGSAKQIELPIPSLKDQDLVLGVLRSLDDRIDNLRETNATLEAIAQALFKSWFVDFDPVRAKAEGREPEGMGAATAAQFPAKMEASEIGLIPEGWQAKPLDSIAKYTNGLALQKYPPESETEFLPVVKIAQLRAGHTVGADRASMNLKLDYVVEDGDVLFSWSGSLLVEQWCGGRGALNQHLFKVTSGEVPKWFYFLATRHHLPHFREVAANKATTMGHIQRRHLAEAFIALPSSTVLEEASKLFTHLLETWLHNAQKACLLQELRDTLLPRLISGKLRLPEAEREVEAATA